MIELLLGYFFIGLLFLVVRFFYHIFPKRNSHNSVIERSSMEIWGYIILNGTDVLTITVVLGYLVQKFMEM